MGYSNDDDKNTPLLEVKDLISKIKRKYRKTKRDERLITPNQMIKELEGLELCFMFLEDDDF
jgi:hypothetical protein